MSFVPGLGIAKGMALTLRRFFEIDADHLVVATLYALSRRGGAVSAQTVRQAAKDLDIRTHDQAPWHR